MCKKKVKNSSAGFALVSALTFSAVVPVSAATLEATYSGNFVTAWERYATGSDGLSTITYGYNTRFINEDYVWANHASNEHYASLFNGEWHTGSSQPASRLSKVEVRHRDSATYIYRCNW